MTAELGLLVQVETTRPCGNPTRRREVPRLTRPRHRRSPAPCHGCARFRAAPNHVLPEASPLHDLRSRPEEMAPAPPDRDQVHAPHSWGAAVSARLWNLRLPSSVAWRLSEQTPWGSPPLRDDGKRRIRPVLPAPTSYPRS